MLRFGFRHFSRLSSRFVLSDAVKSALNQKKGVVALESTVITHGLPYPNNLETACLLEEEVRSEGSTPATIALLDGKVHIGLNNDQLTRVADTMDACKVSRRNIGSTLVKGVVGGTTVAATMLFSHMAGIRVFSTGGIGGVHRGADQTFDISADLLELSKTPVTVVCAGVKSILDISKTVEYLETHSVPTVVFGSQNIFPGFFSPKTESKGQFCTEDLKEVADIMNTNVELGLTSGMVLACPIPAEFQAVGKIIEEAIQQAIRELNEKNIRSQQITPFLLSRVNELTKGASMKTNIALLRNNAKIGGRLAKILSERGPLGSLNSARNYSSRAAPKEQVARKPKVTVIGAAILDFEAITDQDVKDDGGSYVGVITQRCGGVGRNHADALARLGCDSILVTAVGEDSHAKYFFDNCKHIDLSSVEQVSKVPTAVYLSMNNRGHVRYGISSIGEIIHQITPEVVDRNAHHIEESDYLVLDGNLPVKTISRAIEIANHVMTPVWFEPTDIQKVSKVFESGRVDGISVTSPNANEFRQWVKGCGLRLPESVISSPYHVGEFVQSHPTIMKNLDMLIVSLAQHGAAVIQRTSSGVSVFPLPSPVSSEADVVSVSGAGDSLNSWILAGMLHGLPLEKSLQIGQKCAALTLKTTEAVYRRSIGADDVAVITDIKKKHSSHSVTADLSIGEIASAAQFFLADGVIVTGSETGKSANPKDIQDVNKSSSLPVFVGSGLTSLNLAEFSAADSFIVGSEFKKQGKWQNELEPERIRKFMENVTKLG